MTDRRPPAELGAVLADLVRRLGVSKRIEAYRALDLWPEVVGPVLARHSRAEGIEFAVLRVAAENGSWATELAFHKSAILRELQRRGVRGIRSLRVDVSPAWHNGAADEEAGDGRAASSPIQGELLPEAAAALRELEAAGVDRQLIDRWRRLVSAQLRRRERLAATQAGAGGERGRASRDSGPGRRDDGLGA